MNEWMVGTQEPKTQIDAPLPLQVVVMQQGCTLSSPPPQRSTSDLQAGVWNCCTAHKREGISNCNPRLNFSFQNSEETQAQIGWLLLLQVVVQRLHLGFFAAHPYSASWCELAVTPTKEKREESQPNPPTQSLLFGILRVEKGGNPKPKTRNLAQWP